MEAKTRHIVTGAAVAGLGVAIARSVMPKMHDRCQASCGCRCAAEHMSRERETSSTSGVAHVA